MSHATRTVSVLAFLTFAVAAALPSSADAQDCSHDCDVSKRDAHGCCMKAPAAPAQPTPPAQPAKPAARSCAPGKVVNEDTRGNCCWPGQVWSSGHCVGAPTCPGDKIATADDCVCGAGRVVSGDTDGHCCFKGQGWSHQRGVCVGKPTACPPDTTLTNETCRSRFVWVGLAWNDQGAWATRAADTEDEASKAALAACTQSNRGKCWNAKATTGEQHMCAAIYISGKEVTRMQKTDLEEAKRAGAAYCVEKRTGKDDCVLAHSFCNERD